MKWCDYYNCWCDEVEDIIDDADCYFSCESCDNCQEVK